MAAQWYNADMDHTTTVEANERYSVHLGDRGRLVLPAVLRERLGLRQGDRLVITVEADGSMRLRSLRDQIRKVRGIYRDVEPGVSWAEELSRERREEARREQDQ